MNTDDNVGELNIKAYNLITAKPITIAVIFSQEVTKISI